MRRREFITLLGGASVAWPLLAQAQTSDSMRRIIIFTNLPKSHPLIQARLTMFRQELGKLGWNDGRNARIDYESWDGDVGRLRALAKEVVARQPDVIVAQTTSIVSSLLEQTRTIPVVFIAVADPVGSGFVTSWRRPGGNVTGTTGEPTIVGKLLEILKEAAPHITRAGVIFNPDTAPYFAGYYLPSLKATASALEIQLVDASVHDAAEYGKAISALANEPGGGLIVVPDAFASIHQERIIGLAARYRLPAIYPFVSMARDGGLMAYAPDIADQWRDMVPYVDRILKGEKPGDLPVQAPTKFELVINLKTAKGLGLTVPPSLLVRADEVIE